MTDDSTPVIPDSPEDRRKLTFSALMSGLSDLPITLANGKGKSDNAASTLGTSPVPIIQLLDAPLRQLLGTPPISNTSELVFHHIMIEVLDEVRTIMQTISKDNKFTKDQLSQLASTLCNKFSLPDGESAKDLRQISDFLADIHDPIRLGTVSIPESYDDFTTDMWDAQDEDDHAPEYPEHDDADEDDLVITFNDFLKNEDIILHPLAEARRRIGALRDRMHQQQNKIFTSEDGIAVTPEGTAKKLALLDAFADVLIHEFANDIAARRKAQNISSALELPELDLTAKNYAHIFLHGIMYASGACISPDELEKALTKGSDIWQRLFVIQHEDKSPLTQVQQPVVHVNTILAQAGHGLAELC